MSSSPLYLHGLAECSAYNRCLINIYRLIANLEKVRKGTLIFSIHNKTVYVKDIHYLKSVLRSMDFLFYVKTGKISIFGIHSIIYLSNNKFVLLK